MAKCIFVFLLACLTAHSQNSFTVYFYINDDKPSAESSAQLGVWIAQNKNAEITSVFGYADTTGYSVYNIDLSQRRAYNVLQQLKENNIKIAANPEIIGKGESIHNSTNAENRNVEIRYTMIKPPNRQSDLSTAVKAAKKGDRLKLSNLNFYNNSDRILPESKPILDDLLFILLENPLIKIDIQGHICCQPVELDRISISRAAAIYSYLVENGVDKGRLTYQSFGSSRPIHPLPEKSEKQRRENRRVEIEIIEN